jgi:hypothetical protein
MVRRTRASLSISGSGMMTIGIVLSVIAIGVVIFVIANTYWNQLPLSPHQREAHMSIPLQQNQPQPLQLQQPPQSTRTQPNVIMVQSNTDGQDTPFIYENERNIQSPPAKPFYYPTRGVPQSYQQCGVLIGEEQRHRGEQTILPLIGRQTHPGSSRYHYYTSTNGYHPMKLPVVHKKRTCNDSTGCEEIYSGNIVSVNGYDYDFKADIYPSPDLQYIL